MPKKNEKRLATDPFDRFLPQIGDSRKKKDDDINNVDDVDKNTDRVVIVDKNKNINNDVNENINVNSDVDNIVNSNSNSNNAKNVVNDVVVNNAADSSNIVVNDVYNRTDNDAVNDNDPAINVVGTFKIQKKTPKSGHYARATFYLRPDQLHTINKLHKDSGRDKSELVRMAVDILIKQARVE